MGGHCPPSPMMAPSMILRHFEMPDNDKKCLKFHFSFLARECEELYQRHATCIFTRCLPTHFCFKLFTGSLFM